MAARGPLAPPVDWSRARGNARRACGCGGKCGPCARTAPGQRPARGPRHLAVATTFERVSIVDTPAVTSARARAALAPYTRRVESSLRRIARDQGLDFDTLDVEDLVADAELASLLVDGAVRALRLAGPATIRVETPVRLSSPAAGARGRHLAKNQETGEVRYPKGYSDKHDPATGDPTGCAPDQVATVSAAVDRIRARINEVPREFAGQPYRALIQKYLDVWDATYCFDQAYCTDVRGLATCYGGQGYWGGPTALAFGPAFFEPGVAWLIDPIDFRAGIIVHELVHMIDDIEDLDPGDCGHCGDACRLNEYRAAYIQARFMGISKCGADVFGCAYGRHWADVPSDQNAVATIGAFFECYLGAATLLEILTLIALVMTAPTTALTILGVAGLALVALLFAFVFDAWL